jgi:hypothetical protein
MVDDERNAFCNSDYDGDKEIRISMTGFIIYLDEAAISWRLCNKKILSIEAKFVAVSDVCGEIMLMK